nr:unnamed protein product [Spirometra erinaceieuropaei]
MYGLLINLYMENNANILRILVTSDNHVGYLEKDGIRGRDSFTTFEEILYLAQQHDVDFILAGGDLFHENRPSIHCMNEVLRLIRKYCLGDRAVRFEIVSDTAKNFANVSFPSANYTDPNLNVGVPIFSIHGNHDDPAGPGNVCAPDLLHSCGFLNLFGKSSSIETLEVSPLLLRKGSTKLAIYGIGAVREERLHRLFLNDNVTFWRPEDDAEDWFSLAVVHQNRVRHGPTGYLPENFLPSFLDLVVWGHEHDCRIEPEWNSSKNFYVTQPGSSVATSLIEGEALPKAVGLLEIHGREFKLTRLPLQTVRPFFFYDLVLEEELADADVNSLNLAQRVEEVCTDRISQAISKAAAATAAAISQEKQRLKAEEGETQSRPRFLPPAEPICRLRVDTSGGFESFSTLRFGQKFVGRVANPKDLIKFNRNRERAANRSGPAKESECAVGSAAEAEARGVGLSVDDVETLVCRILASNKNANLRMFTDAELSRGLRHFVDQTDGGGIKSMVDAVVANTQGHLCVHQCTEDRVASEISHYMLTRKREASINGEASADAPSVTASSAPDKASSSNSAVVDLEKEWDTRSTVLVRRQMTPTGLSPHIFDGDSSDKEGEGREGHSDQNLINQIKDVEYDSTEDGSIASDASSLSGHTRARGASTRGSRRGRDWQSKQLDSILADVPAHVSRAASATSGGRVRRPRGARGAASTRRQAPRRRGGATQSSLMPDSEDSDDGSLSFDFRRKRGKLS